MIKIYTKIENRDFKLNVYTTERMVKRILATSSRIHFGDGHRNILIQPKLNKGFITVKRQMDLLDDESKKKNKANIFTKV